jgi:DNA-directed RNA polymerase specialized sigma24 family protein
MPPDEDVTRWIHELQAGERAAVQKLWEGYFQRLVAFAHKKLAKVPRLGAGSEDVALSAFKSFCLRAEKGGFPQLEDRDDLWQILVMLTRRKAIDLLKHEQCQRRDHRRVEAGGSFVSELVGQELDHPAFTPQLTYECQALLGQLKDDELRQIAVSRMEGYTNEEIAARLDIGLSTVERRLKLIRKEWGSELVS